MNRALIALSMLALACSAAPAPAVIKALTPLSKVVGPVQFIFVAEVDKVDPDKPSVIFKHAENLKGKTKLERLPVNLTGDSFAEKDGHAKVMLDRLAPGRKLILFISERDGKYAAFGFLEGTWFQMNGSTDPETKAVRWAFLHAEPYFRRTFKGTTAEMKAVIEDALSGKKKPPEPNEDEPHGYGPTVEEEKKKKDEPEPRANGRPQPAGFVSGPLFGVIPSFVLIGPLAVLAAIFPNVFAGLAGGLQRWRVFLVVTSINSTLAAIYYFTRSSLPEVWFVHETAFTALLLVVTFAGLAVAGMRYRVLAQEDPRLTEAPDRKEFLTLGSFALGTALALVGIGWYFGFPELVHIPGREMTAAGVGLILAVLYAGYRMVTADGDLGPEPVRVSVSGESAGLLGILLFGFAMLIFGLPGAGTIVVTGELGDAAAAPSRSNPVVTDGAIWFETPDIDKVMSGVCFTAERAYFGGSRTTAGVFNDGVLVCVDLATSRQLWKFAKPEMKTIFSTPAVADGKLYFGEGLHTDSRCKLYCLDAATGTELWAFTAKSHNEGPPFLADGKVYFSAGDDGLYCLDAASGKEIWHYAGEAQKLHIDTPVIVTGGKLYAGSGYNTFAVFCLDAKSGKEIWKIETPLRSFGSPLAVGKHVVFGLGTGALTNDLSTEPEPGQPPEKIAAGMVLCLDGATGQEVWKFELSRSVHTQICADAGAVYFASRNAKLYALNRDTGRMIWNIDLGTPMVSGPTIVSYLRGNYTAALYAVTMDGRVYCHNPRDGKIYWTRSIREATGRAAEVMSQPVWLPGSADGGVRHLYIPASLKKPNNAEETGAIVRFTDELGE